MQYRREALTRLTATLEDYNEDEADAKQKGERAFVWRSLRSMSCWFIRQHKRLSKILSAEELQQEALDGAHAALDRGELVEVEVHEDEENGEDDEDEEDQEEIDEVVEKEEDSDNEGLIDEFMDDVACTDDEI